MARPLFTDEKRARLRLYGRQVAYGCIGLSVLFKADTTQKSAHAGDTAGRVTTGVNRDTKRH
jgi:lipoprotein NlpI